MRPQIVIGGGSQRRMFRDVLPVWTAMWEGCGLAVDMLSEPPADLALLYEHNCSDKDAATSELAALVRDSISGHHM